MTLETYSDLPMESPLRMVSETHYPHLQEDTMYTLLHIRGIDAETVLGQPSMKIGDVVGLPGEGMLVRLRRDEFLLFAVKGQVALNWLKKLTDEQGVTVTDITHGRCTLFLAGIDVKSVLRKVCGLDFSDAAFPVEHAAQTSLAKVRTLIIRRDFGARQAYSLIVDRSLAQYVWDVVFDAMQEFAG